MVMNVSVKDGRPAPHRKMQALPHPAAKIGKTCGAERGKVKFNPSKFRRVITRKESMTSG